MIAFREEEMTLPLLALPGHLEVSCIHHRLILVRLPQKANMQWTINKPQYKTL